MTALLEKAFAERILADLESERRWNQLFEASQDLLTQWADEALAEHRAGKTIPVDWKFI